MYLRVTHVRNDPAKVDEAIAIFKERSVPGARATPGFGGVILTVDRGSGDAYAGTYWLDLAAMNAAEQAGRDLRRQTSEATGAEILDVDRFEMVLVERRGVAVPSFCRTNELYADPSRAGATVETLRNAVVPVVSGLEGFLSLTSFVNRVTGRTLVTTVWATAEARAAGAQAVAGPRRQVAQSAGADGVRVQEMDVAVLQLN